MLDKVGHCVGIFVASRYEVVVEVTFDIFVTVFEVDVVWLPVVGFNPEVEIIFFGHSGFDHRVACIGIVRGAGREA